MTISRDLPDGVEVIVQRWRMNPDDAQRTETIQTLVSNVDVELKNDTGPEIQFTCYGYTEDESQLFTFHFTDLFAEQIADL